MSNLSVKLAAIRRQHNTAGDWEVTLELLRALARARWEKEGGRRKAEASSREKKRYPVAGSQ